MFEENYTVMTQNSGVWKIVVIKVNYRSGVNSQTHQEKFLSFADKCRKQDIYEIYIFHSQPSGYAKKSPYFCK